MGLVDELSRLKKEFLVEMLVRNRVPEGVKVSAAVRELVEGGRKLGSLSQEIADPKLDSNLTENVQVVVLNSEIKVLKTELQCSQRIVREKERTIEYQEMVISLLKGRGEGNKHGQKSAVVDTTQMSVAQKSVRLQSASDDVFRGGQRSKDPVPETCGRSSAVSGAAETVSRASKPIRSAVSGTNKTQEATFSAALRRAWLHVGRVNQDAKPEDIRGYLQRRFPGHDFVIEPLPRREDAASVSFKVGADLSLLDELNKAEIWPEGVTVRRFKFFRAKNEVH